MTGDAAPSPAELPLSGGREGATVRLHPLLAGTLRAPPGLLERESPFASLRSIGVGVPKSRWVWIPVPAFLVEHPVAGPILIDTGFHPSVAQDPKLNLGRLGKLLYDYDVGPDQAPHVLLRARGVDPGEVKVVVMSHLHLDHASAVSEFPDATFVVTDREWKAAMRPAGMLRGYHRPLFDLPFDWRTVDLDGGVPYGGFERTIDLLGDGSVRLLATPGHTVGHQSVLLRLRDREALLTVDAAYTREAIERELLPGIAQDDDLAGDSVRRVKRYVGQNPDALIIPGHDRETWPTLEVVYD